MKVISPRREVMKSARTTCLGPECLAVLEYTQGDIIKQSNRFFVICPECGHKTKVWASLPLDTPKPPR